MDLGHLIQTHGYWVLALGCLLEGETPLALAGVAARAGYLDPGAVIAIAAASAFLGDQFFFWLGRWYGPVMLSGMPRIARHGERIHRLIERHPGWAVIGVRFAYGLRIAGPMLLGASGLQPWRFAVFNALGAILWAMLIAGLGWGLGHAIEVVFGEIRRMEIALVIGLLIAALGYAWTLHQRGRRR